MSTNPYGMARFMNKVAVVTGGASGIGRATAVRLAAEGAHAIIVDNNPALGNQTADRIKADGGNASFLECDLADDAAVDAVGRTAATQFPAVHLLVNNAAIVRQGLIEDGGWLANWEIETRIGLRGWILYSRRCCCH